MSDKAIGYLGLMRRGGMIELGENGVAEAVRGRKATLLLLVPDGRLPSRRWRPWATAAVGLQVLAVAAWA